jgi:hypothetical protein
LTLDQWELDAIAAMDTARLNLLHTRIEQALESEQVSSRLMSTALFDALFSGGES